MALKNAKIITVTSVKGGVGKTNVVLNLAGAFANQHKKVLVVDLDLYTGSLALLFKVADQPNIFNFAADLMVNKFKQTSDYIKKYNDYIDILPAPRDPRNVNKIDIKYIDLLIKKLIHIYDVILIDTNHLADTVKLISLDLSDNIIYVMTNDLCDLKNMKTMISIYEDMENTKYKLILNEALSHENYNHYDVRNVIGVDIDYILPHSSYQRNFGKNILNGSVNYFEKINPIFNQIANDLLKEVK